MLQELINEQKTGLAELYDNLSLPELERLLQALYTCKGLIFCTGMGKSAFVAQKVAATMSSTGTRAIFLSSTDAMHGDLGMVSAGDMILFFSKSGESDELITLAPYLRNKGALLAAIVHSPKSRLEENCSIVVHLAEGKELCPFNMVPTTSSVTQMLLGDLLAVGLMKLHQFSVEDFARNHPAGRLGKRISMHVRDKMWTGTKVPKCHPEDRLIDVLQELSSKSCGAILIVDNEEKLLGIFTDGDLRRSLQSKGSDVLNTPMRQLMSTKPTTSSPNQLLWDVMREMEARSSGAITVMPVLDEERRVLGVIRMHDIIQAGL